MSHPPVMIHITANGDSMYRTEIQTADLDVYGVVCDTYRQALTVAVAAVTNPNGADVTARVFDVEDNGPGATPDEFMLASMFREGA